MPISITLNGEIHNLDEIISVAQLLHGLNLQDSKVAIEKNLEIVPRSTYEQEKIYNGDAIEVVHFIGGG
jgi:thiamine biosynthesis protein ThiS